MNRFIPHVLILPEDDANRQIALGFRLEVTDAGQMKILPNAGGWREVLKIFKDDHIPEMERNSFRLMVLVIDFDDRVERVDEVRAVIPSHLTDRVFVLGSKTEPEPLKQVLRCSSYEKVGSLLAADCRDNETVTWSCELLEHNLPEIDRLRVHAHHILF
jgi:hypothetical protein